MEKREVQFSVHERASILWPLICAEGHVCSFIGPTGSGKSQVGFVFPDDFTPADHSKKVIDTLTGQKRRTGTTLQSVTDEVSAHRVLGHEKYGNKLVLVDTPGFDNPMKAISKSSR